MRRINNRRAARYGSVALILTLLTLAAVIIANVISGFLATRYEWMFVNMNHQYAYDISDNCREYVEKYVIPTVDKKNADKEAEGKTAEKIKIIFCDDKENIMAEDYRKYVHDSVYELRDMFPEYIEIEYLDIWENPSIAKKYGVTAITNLVCAFDGRYETVDSKDFHIYDSANPSVVTAYNGEKMLAACLLRATQEETPMCYFTANHGESFEDYEFMRTVVEAGYTIGFLDLLTEDIPEDCELLITFAPKQDMVIANDISAVSEIDKLNDYMENGGKYMVFLSADTFVSGERKNLEGFLAEWGVKYMHEKGDEDIENCYVIKDSANSLTVDGYTIIADKATSGIGGEIMADLPSTNVFGNSTCISFTENYKSDGKGNYVFTENGRTRKASALMTSHSSAEAWSGGRAVARALENPFVLMSVTTELCANGETACLIASASTDFAASENMSSAVIGNARTLTGIYKYMGRESAPTSLTFKYLGSTEIESLTMRNAYIITAVMATVPTLICIACGAVVLIRRRYS